MVQHYKDLNDLQKQNLNLFLDRGQTHELDKLKIKFNIGSGRGLEKYRQNVLDGVMFEQIPFYDFLLWCAQVDIDGNNTLFVYEPKDQRFFAKNKMEKFLHLSTYPLYDINKDTLTEAHLVAVYKPEEKNQIIFTLAAPCQISVKDEKTKEIELKKSIYLSYVVMDYDLKHFVLMMHPTANLHSILGQVKDKDLEEFADLLIYNFKNLVVHFESSEPEWIINALFSITEEYFHHNNPTISNEVESFNNQLTPKILDLIKDFNPQLDQKPSLLRIKRSLKNLIENELITIHGPIPKAVSFEVFLQQSNKGVTEFKANNKGKPFNFAVSRDIIKQMWTNGNLVSLGVIHTTVLGRKIPYVVSKSGPYYSLKRTTTGTTEKEVVDDVLRKLNKYKPADRPRSGDPAQTR